MIFNIYLDSGDIVSGTVIPDSFSEAPQIRVTVDGRVVMEFPTDLLNKDVLDLGQHSTGLVNFSLTEKMLPGLAGIEDLELHDVGTNLLLYRRLKPSMISMKILRIETHLMPLWRLDEAVKPLFQQYYKGVEALGRSGTMQIFHLSQDSIYVSGRVLIKNFMHAVHNGFKFVSMLNDPYEELAERLIILNRIDKIGLSALGSRERLVLRDAIDFATALPLDDEKAVARALRRIPMNVAMALANPVVRQFSTTNIDDQPRGSAVAGALDILAQSIVVGLRSEPEAFIDTFAGVLGVAPKNLPAPPRFSRVVELAEVLRASRTCDVILEKDLELFGYIQDAYKKALATADTDGSPNA